jgi:hypothetical protein
MNQTALAAALGEPEIDRPSSALLAGKSRVPYATATRAKKVASTRSAAECPPTFEMQMAEQHIFSTGGTAFDTSTATLRVFASCANSAMIVKFDDARHWVYLHEI